MIWIPEANEHFVIHDCTISIQKVGTKFQNFVLTAIAHCFDYHSHRVQRSKGYEPPSQIFSSKMWLNWFRRLKYLFERMFYQNIIKKSCWERLLSGELHPNEHHYRIHIPKKDLCLKFLQTHCTQILMVLLLILMVSYGKRLEFTDVILCWAFNFPIFAQIMPQSEKVAP